MKGGCTKWEFQVLHCPDHTRRRCDHAYGGSAQEHDRTGVGVDSLGCHADPRLRLHDFLISWFSVHDYSVVDIHSLIVSS